MKPRIYNYYILLMKYAFIISSYVYTLILNLFLLTMVYRSTKIPFQSENRVKPCRPRTLPDVKARD